MPMILKTISYTIEGRPKPKERPRHTIGNVALLATAVYKIFHTNKTISLPNFIKKFAGVLSKFTKNSQSTIYTPTATQNYEELVGLISKIEINNNSQGLELVEGKIFNHMITVHIDLYFSDKKVGDVDNYTKSILDGMHTIFEDDKQVKKVIVEKFITVDENGDIIEKGTDRAEIKIDILDLPVYYTSKTRKLMEERMGIVKPKKKVNKTKKPNKVNTVQNKGAKRVVKKPIH